MNRMRALVVFLAVPRPWFLLLVAAAVGIFVRCTPTTDTNSTAGRRGTQDSGAVQKAESAPAKITDRVNEPTLFAVTDQIINERNAQLLSQLDHLKEFIDDYASEQ